MYILCPNPGTTLIFIQTAAFTANLCNRSSVQRHSSCNSTCNIAGNRNRIGTGTWSFTHLYCGIDMSSSLRWCNIGAAGYSSDKCFCTRSRFGNSTTVCYDAPNNRSCCQRRSACCCNYLFFGSFFFISTQILQFLINNIIISVILFDLCKHRSPVISKIFVFPEVSCAAFVNTDYFISTGSFQIVDAQFAVFIYCKRTAVCNFEHSLISIYYNTCQRKIIYFGNI